MNPQEKAEELRNRFLNNMPKYLQGKLGLKTSKENALLTVNEILKNIDATIFYHEESKALPFNKAYWNEVKEHLTNLN